MTAVGNMTGVGVVLDILWTAVWVAAIGYAGWALVTGNVPAVLLDERRRLRPLPAVIVAVVGPVVAVVGLMLLGGGD